MQIDDIRISALNHERDTGRKPAFVLLTSAEYAELKREAEAMSVMWAPLDAVKTQPSEIDGLIVVIYDSRFHQALADAGVELLRPVSTGTPMTIYYVRDNHTFKRLHPAPKIAVMQVEREFDEGWTYGTLLCREQNVEVHAHGEKDRERFIAECAKALTELSANT